MICFNKGLITNAFCGDLQGIDAAYSLFGWTEGEFEFDVSRVEKDRVITQSLMEIIMEGSRMLDEGRIKELGAENQDIAKPFRPHLEEGVNFVPSPDVDYSYVVEEEVFSPGRKHCGGRQPRKLDMRHSGRIRRCDQGHQKGGVLPCAESGRAL